MLLDYSKVLSNARAQIAGGVAVGDPPGEIVLVAAGNLKFGDPREVAVPPDEVTRIIGLAASNISLIASLRRLLANEMNSTDLARLSNAQVLKAVIGAIERHQIYGFYVEDIIVNAINDEWPLLWLGAYRLMPAQHQTKIEFANDERYNYQFDIESSRVVAAYGAPKRKTSARKGSEREKRQRGFLSRATSAAELERIRDRTMKEVESRTLKHGSTGVLRQAETLTQQRQTSAQLSFTQRYPGYERGHFMSDQQGGLGDINLFPQLKQVNLSGEWRTMEDRCANDPDVIFCFQRPIYNDGSWMPAQVEYGIVSRPDQLTVKSFLNK